MAEEEQRKSKKPDEDPVGKVYDSRLIRRLGHYLRPYWWQTAVSTLAISLKSICDVTGPYLVKVAIDRYLTGAPGPATNWLTRRLRPTPTTASPSWPASISPRFVAPISSNSFRLT